MRGASPEGSSRALGPGAAQRVAVLTGTLRGHERALLTEGAVWRRFTPEATHPPDAPSVYLVSTAAGEVGVDLDADHAVMDLATLDSMIQRLGRVNRAGEGDAQVTIVFTTREASGPALGAHVVPRAARGRTRGDPRCAAASAELESEDAARPRPRHRGRMLRTVCPARPARRGGARGVRGDLAPRSRARRWRCICGG